MTEQANEPGPGRHTSESAFNNVKKLIAERNEAASKVARKLRDAKDRLKADEKRERDLR